MPSKFRFKNVVADETTLYNEPIKIIPPPEGVSIGKYCAIGPNLLHPLTLKMGQIFNVFYFFIRI